MAAEEMFRAADDLPAADRHLLIAIRKTLWGYEPLRATRPTLTIGVQDGRVVLTGRVRTLAIKEIAEYMVLRTNGVRAVRNDLLADPEVARAVADAVAADPELGPLCPRIDAREGVVHLAGDVPSEAIAQRLIDLAASLPLVASVTSYLTVEPIPALATNGALAHGAANGTVAVVAPAESSEG
jgi:osmotically-inducible protein OsmY